MRKFSKWLKKYFIPHEHNEFKPHFLRHESMFFFAILVIIVELSFLTQIFVVFDKTNFLASVLPAVLTRLTNKERAENNVAPLTENDLLKKAAELKAQDMARYGYFAHTSPDGKTPWYWLDQVGYKYRSAGENLAVNFFESSDVAEAWMNSPTHRENIVKKNYTEIGIGIASGIYEGEHTVFVAQFFGTPIPVFAQTTPPTNTVAVNTTPAPNSSGSSPEFVNSPKPTPTPTPKPVPPEPTTTPTSPAPEPSTVVTTTTETGDEVQVLGEETNSLAQRSPEESVILKFKSLLQKILTSPREYVTYIYLAIIILIILTFLFVLFIRAELAHPAIIWRGGALMAIIFVLLFANLKLSSELNTKIPAEGLSASVIAY